MTFSEVAGMDEAKVEVQEIIDILKAYMPNLVELYTDRYESLRNGQAVSSQLSTERSEMRSFPMPIGRPREFDTEKALELATTLFWRKG